MAIESFVRGNEGRPKLVRGLQMSCLVFAVKSGTSDVRWNLNTSLPQGIKNVNILSGTGAHVKNVYFRMRFFFTMRQTRTWNYTESPVCIFWKMDLFIWLEIVLNKSRTNSTVFGHSWSKELKGLYKMRIWFFNESEGYTRLSTKQFKYGNASFKCGLQISWMVFCYSAKLQSYHSLPFWVLSMMVLFVIYKLQWPPYEIFSSFSYS